ncbi:hypothetical protein [Algoriphagus limi]|uniref:Uncharacterized protein n=1 Tax=Algoriphagus limi TaxID=2975273 RepID=A0ABT2G0X3_9BACT|nr:hypothetical protein [Algoriphagus limi]MCS5488919.1 hypothetical protein [Algoriphagus limi]
MNALRILFFISMVACVFSCSDSDDSQPVINDPDSSVGTKDPNGGTSDPPLTPGQSLVTGLVELPESINPESLKIVSPAGSYEVNNDGTFKAIVTENSKQVLMVEDQDGDILLASISNSSQDTLNAKTTTRAIVGLAPWSGLVENDELEIILDEFEKTPQYKSLENVVENVIRKGISPLDDSEVIEMLGNLFSQAPIDSRLTSRIFSIPEVDNIVEPNISYSNGSFTISNDGTTTAVWGVEVFDKNKESLTGRLMLEGNKVMFPSLTSIWKFITGDLLDAVFERSESLVVPVIIEDKYEIQFGSPTRLSLNPALSFEAARFNIYNSYQTVFSALGIKLKGLSPSEYFEQGCLNDFFDATTKSLVDLLTKRELTAEIFLSQFSTLFSGSIGSLAECSSIFDDFDGSTPSSLDKYLKNLAKFLNAYEKVEAAFITGKLIGDMLVLSDIQICRQVINGKIYPCFTLSKGGNVPTEINSPNKAELYVEAELDILPEESDVFPIGAPIAWEVIEGDGTLNKNSSPIDNLGKSVIIFSPGKAEKNIILASVKDKDGNMKDQIEFEVTAKFIDSLALYKEAIVGTWDVIAHSTNSKYRMIIGQYNDNSLYGKYWAVDNDGNQLSYGYNISPSIYIENERYHLQTGIYLWGRKPTDPLTYPPTEFNEYHEDGKLYFSYKKIE